jgi:hypothetical protein
VQNSTEMGDIVMKYLLTALLLCASINANAGFISGMVVGSLLSEGNNKAKEASTVIFSDKHDVIICAQGANAGKCLIIDGGYKYYTPAQYAGRAGYKTLYKTGVLIMPDKTIYLIMEVSK